MNQNAQKLSAGNSPISTPPRFADLAPKYLALSRLTHPIEQGDKGPVWVDRKREERGRVNWRKNTPELVEERIKKYPGAGTGLPMGNGLGALDVDVDSQQLATAIAAVLAGEFGDLVIRYRANSSRFACFFGTDRNYDKGVLTLERVDPSTGELEKAEIEWFADPGHYLVVSGMHESGVPLLWKGRDLADVPDDELPQLDERTLDRVRRRVVEIAAADGWRLVGDGIRSKSLRLATKAANDDMFVVRAEDRFSLETNTPDEVRHLLEAKDPNESYHEWFLTLASLARWDAGEVGHGVATEWSRCVAYPDAERKIRSTFDSVIRGDEDRADDEKRTLASLIEVRKKYDEELRRKALDEPVLERVEEYRVQLEAPGEDNLEWRHIAREIKADDVLTVEARELLKKPLQARIERAGLSRLSAQTLRDLLMPEQSPTVATAPGRVDVVGRVIADFDRALTYYCDSEGRPYAERVEEGSRVTLEPSSPELDAWLVVHAESRYGKRLTKFERTDVHEHVAAKARLSGLVLETRIRYAHAPAENGAPDRLFEDVGDKGRTVLEISASGVREVAAEEPLPFRFKPGRGAVASSAHRPVAVEELPAGAEHLLAQMNVPAGMEIPLLALLVDWRMPHTSCPILLATGGYGSGKSAIVEQCVELTDPQAAKQVGQSLDVKTLRTRLGSSWVTAEHNAQRYGKSMQNDLCLAADGESLEDRKLHTNREVEVTRAAGPIAISAISASALSQVDLASRVLELRMTPPPEGERLTPPERRQRFAEALTAHRALLRTLTVEVLRLWPEVTDTRGHRYGSYARVVACVAKILGEPRSFVELMSEARECETVEAFEGSLFAQDVLQFVAGCCRTGWEGTSADLLGALSGMYVGRPGEGIRRQRTPGYPQVGRDVWGALDEVEGPLSLAGVNFGRGRRTKRGQLVRLSLNENAPGPGIVSRPWDRLMSDLGAEFNEAASS